MNHPDNLVPTSSRPRPESRDDLRNRARPSSPSPSGDELELESNHHPVENHTQLVPGTTSRTTSPTPCIECGGWSLLGYHFATFDAARRHLEDMDGGR